MNSAFSFHFWTFKKPSIDESSICQFNAKFESCHSNNLPYILFTYCFYNYSKIAFFTVHHIPPDGKLPNIR